MPIIIILVIIIIVLIHKNNKKVEALQNELKDAKQWDGQGEGFHAMRILLSDEYDEDLIDYLAGVKNKSEFFKKAARSYIEDEVY